MTCRIAVVGMACRYPDADDPHQLWQTVLAGRRAFRRIPPERLRVADYQDTPGGPDAPDGIHARQAAVLENWTFDRSAYRVPGPAYRATDLTHWLALDVAAAALRDAGLPDGEGLDRDRAGVVIGNSLTGEFSRAGLVRLRWPYVRRTLDQVLRDRGTDPAERRDLLRELEAAYKAPFPAPGDETLAGGLANTISGRVCNHFDFHGAGYTVDGACASSLISVATACTALAQGDLDFALAGGVDLSLDPFELVGFSRLGALARGPMRVYDRNPTGFLPGEGCGMVALAREGDAERMGLRVHARIEGWGLSSDGHGGLTRPERTGQALALRRAYARAGFGPERTGLIEGHGTGTAVGDQVELAVLDAELRAAGAAGTRPAALGSIKANIGHTKAAAGVAGLIKAVLAVRDGVLPPTTGCPDPHPLLGADDAALRTLTAPEEWPDRERHASVNSLGFGGINAHVVVGAGPAARPSALTAVDRRRYAPAPGWEVFPVSGDDAHGLAARLETLAATAETLSGAEFVDAAAELVRRADPARPWRTAVVAGGPAQLAERLRHAAGRLRDDAAGARAFTADARHGTFTGSGPRARLGLLFPGQGTGARTAAGTLSRLVPADDLFAAVPEAKAPEGREAPQGPDAPGDSEPADTAVVQPAVVAASLAGLRYLDELGVRADAALGHSLGELTALCWAGALTPADAVRLAAARGALMARHAERGGGMLAVAAPPEAAEALLHGTDAVVAAVNGPRHVTVAGPLPVLGLIRERAARQGTPALPLPVSHAFHSAAMRPALAALARCFADAPLAPLTRTAVSSVTGTVIAPGTDLAALLTEQVLKPVAFAPGVRELARHADLLLEVGPGRALTTLAAPGTDLPVLSLDTTGEPEALATATAALYAACGADPSPWTRHRFSRPIDLTRPRRFLTNPCELAPLPDTDPGTARPGVAPAPVHGTESRHPSAADEATHPGTPATTAAPRPTPVGTPAPGADAAPYVANGTGFAAAAGRAPHPGAPGTAAVRGGGSDDAPPSGTDPSAPYSGTPAPGPTADGAPGPAVGAAPRGEAASDDDPLDAVRALVADALELGAESVRADDLLLADLHINSLRVAQIAADAAARLGRAAPATTAPLAGATVGGLAAYV
uniref:beta-ketoacyl synthase N-terminal-like domain-containing protein n=1 Tax=Streptomyces sp. TRM64462 TaxID=2741726 RepID=UPI001585F558